MRIPQSDVGFFTPIRQFFSDRAFSSRNLLSLLALLFLVGHLLPSGCRAPEQKRYPISQAEVIGVDLPHKLIIIRHGDIPGFMPAMAMSYSLASPKQAESLGPGDKISADLVVSENVGHLEKILLLEKAKLSPVPAPPPAPAPLSKP